MDWPPQVQNLPSLLSGATPLLPGSALLKIGLPVAWALVLMCGALVLGRNLSWPTRVVLALLLGVTTLMPGPLSPAYYLSLAFQMPSLMTLALCLIWAMAGRSGQAPRAGFKPWVGVGVVLGWVLLLDTLALLPFQVYRWGFSPLAVAAFAVVGCVPALLPGRAASSLRGSALVLCVLAWFVVTRLPTGNVFDALMDPWLWLALQTGWLARGWRRFRAVRAGRVAPPAIRG